MNTITTTTTETWQLGHLVYTKTRNHTKLPVYKGVYACLQKEVTTLFNATIYFDANTSAKRY